MDAHSVPRLNGTPRFEIDNTPSERDEESQILDDLARIGILDPVRGEVQPLLLNIANTRSASRRGYAVLRRWFTSTTSPHLLPLLALGLQWAPESRRSEAADLLYGAWKAQVRRPPSSADFLETLESSLVRVIRDPQFDSITEALSIAPSRSHFFIEALGHMQANRDAAIAVAMSFLGDPMTRNPALIALGRLAAEEARSEFENSMREGDGYQRRIARSALQRLDRAE